MRGDTGFVHALARQLPQFFEKGFEGTTTDLLTIMTDCGARRLNSGDRANRGPTGTPKGLNKRRMRCYELMEVR